MSLREFLQGKTGTAEELLALAKAEKVTVGKLIHRDSMNSLLASAGMYNALKAIAADTNNPDSDAMAAFLDSTEYNFIVGDTTGDRQIAAMDAIISEGGVLGAGLGAIKPVIIAMANRESDAYPNVTLHDIKTATGTITRVSKQAVNGWLKITTTADCEAHRPQIYVDVQGVLQRVAGFNVVSVKGDYVAQVPRVYAEYFVDDAYGVIV